MLTAEPDSTGPEERRLWFDSLVHGMIDGLTGCTPGIDCKYSSDALKWTGGQIRGALDRGDFRRLQRDTTGPGPEEEVRSLWGGYLGTPIVGPKLRPAVVEKMLTAKPDSTDPSYLSSGNSSSSELGDSAPQSEVGMIHV